MQQATSHISKIRMFFSDLGGFAAFFSWSFKWTTVSDQVVAHTLPGTSTTRWNLHSHVVNMYEHKGDLLQCFQTIRNSGDFDPATVREAGAFMLENARGGGFLPSPAIVSEDYATCGHAVQPIGEEEHYLCLHHKSHPELHHQPAKDQKKISSVLISVIVDGNLISSPQRNRWHLEREKNSSWLQRE